MNRFVANNRNCKVLFLILINPKIKYHPVDIFFTSPVFPNLGLVNKMLKPCIEIVSRENVRSSKENSLFFRIKHHTQTKFKR